MIFSPYCFVVFIGLDIKPQCYYIGRAGIHLIYLFIQCMYSSEECTDSLFELI